MISAINGYKLPQKDFNKLKVEQYAGYLMRRAVNIEYDNKIKIKKSNKEVNAEFLLWFGSIFGENSNEFKKLRYFQNKIENPNEYIKSLSNDLFFDYDCDIESGVQTRLISLEQFLILNELVPSYLYLISESVDSNLHGNDLSWIKKLDRKKLNLLVNYLNEYFQYSFDRQKEIWKINGFEIYRNLDIEQYAGYLTRKSTVFLNNEIMKYDKANEIFISWFSSEYKDNKQLETLNRYKFNIENPSNTVIELGKMLINDYNSNYIYSQDYPEESTTQMCLIKLEQFFIIHKLPPIYIYEFMKTPNAFGKNVLDWIIIVTQNMFKNKLLLLIEYLDEYFQHLFDRSKYILKINNLDLPVHLKSDVLISNPTILPIPINDKSIKIDQCAAYFTRESIVTIRYIYNTKLVSHYKANRCALHWFRTTFKNDSKKLNIIENYLYRVENISNQIKTLENELTKNRKNSIQRNSLINLEQLFIRHNLQTSLIYEYTKPNNPICNNKDIIEWIINIVKDIRKLERVVRLKEYLDEFLYYVIERPKNRVSINEIWYPNFLI